ncbi:MAG: CpaF family protein [Deltaproteobacteria bacterium]|nr:CpaF family protein [Deltaproteobacteria bacterium]
MIPKEVYEETLLSFLAPVRPFLDDAKVSEIMINGPNQIFIEKAGRLILTDARFPSVEALNSALRNIAQFVGKMVDEDHPILEARLPDGSRIEAIVPPAAPDGPDVAIRRFFKETLTVQRLVEFGSMTPEAALFLEALVSLKQNVVVAGGTGSGKTSLLNALSGFIPDAERIVIIEDSREVQLQKQHVVQLEARPGDAKGRGKVGIRDLFRATLRMRPDRIVVGEIRGGEALDLVQAMTSGHGGCLTTVHATYPHDTLTRLETMALMSDVELPLSALRVQLGSAINIIVQTTRLTDGTRKVSHISEVRGYDAQEGFKLVDLFLRRYEGRDERGYMRSVFEPTGELPLCTEMVHSFGMAFPAAVYEAARARGAGWGAEPADDATGRGFHGGQH